MASRYEGSFSTIATLYFQFCYDHCLTSSRSLIIWVLTLSSSAFSIVLGLSHLQFFSGAVVHPVYEGAQLSSMVKEVRSVILAYYSTVIDVLLLG